MNRDPFVARTREANASWGRSGSPGQGGWLDTEAARAYLRLSKKALYQAVRRGMVPVHRLGRRLRFSIAELDAVVLDGGSR
jgi:excisionase family DNA binding protein